MRRHYSQSILTENTDRILKILKNRADWTRLIKRAEAEHLTLTREFLESPLSSFINRLDEFHIQDLGVSSDAAGLK